MNVRDVLVEAKRLVEAGWTQGHYASQDGAFCVKGAIAVASGAMTVMEPEGATWVVSPSRGVVRLKNAAQEAVAAHIPIDMPDGQPPSIPHWNDLPTTTHADVLAVLDKAISAC